METELEQAMSKHTPASWIHNIGQKLRSPPMFQFEDMKDNLEWRIPSFKCVLRMKYNGENFIAEAVDRSKQDAKHGAAQVMLLQRMKLTPKDFYEIGGDAIFRSKFTSVAENDSANVQNMKMKEALWKIKVESNDGEMAVNPIGYLQDLCIKMGLSGPVYEDSLPEGPSHRTTCQSICKVANIETSDKARSKKLAKRAAAFLMIQELRGSSIEQLKKLSSNDNLDYKPSGDKFSTQQLSDYDYTAAQRTCGLTFEECKNRVSHLNHAFRRMLGDLIHQLNVGEHSLQELVDLNGGSVNLLNKIAEENNFTVAYCKVSLPSIKGALQMFVTCSTTPPISLFAKGSKDEAVKAAVAYDALEYLKLMSRH